MNNNLQIELLKQISTIHSETKASIEQNTVDAINKFSLATGIDYSTTVDGNIYIIFNYFLNELQKKQLEYYNFLANLYEIFDTEKFTGYIASNYAGFRAGMLALDFIDDCKLLPKENNTLQIILYSNDNIDLTTTENKFKIASKIHEYNPLSLTFNGDAGAIEQQITASTGQAISYNYYVVSKRVFDITVKFNLDYEDDVKSITYKSSIEIAVKTIYTNLYNKIGKNFSVKDFYSITSILIGIKDISIVVVEGENTFTDADIPISILEIFTINKITSEQLN
jgi:hypothetical protein